MPGPPPKPASTRARRNKTSTAALLKVDPSLKAPELPEREWHPMTEEWWADVWASPMAPEFHESDRHGLVALALLIDDYWLADSPTLRAKLAAERRMQEMRFGLSPIDRRRLQWEIERTEDAQDRGEERRARRAAPKAVKPAADPRSALRAV